MESCPVVTQTVTLTQQGILFYPVVGTCTTISGTSTLTYIGGYLGQYTSVTTIYPSQLPPEYTTTVTTASTISAIAYTESYTGPPC
jgi:hypothetical protein